jgi:RNA-directed DNA polymerase
MEVPYSEGLATHAVSESCIGAREDADEALTGVRAGWVLSRERYAPPRGGLLRGADAVEISGRQNPRHRQGEMLRDPARSETPGMYASTSYGNREIPLASVIARSAERVGRSQDRSR